MFSSIGNLFGRKPPQKGGPLIPEPTPASRAPAQNGRERGQTFSKVFRWRLPDGETHEPASVEIVGSFTHWQKVPLMRDSALDAWHTTVHHIPGNRTHHYMFLVDGKPTYDKTCDGLAVPHGPNEEQYQMMTDRGPRVFMLFAQTK
jgi:Glycogen recognition site of AMP-activated protein kinase